MRKIITAIIGIFIFLTMAGHVSASSHIAGGSAQMRIHEEDKFDYRVVSLRKFLESHNSPLAPYSAYFIEVADKYDLDWRLVPAIAGVESTFGKRIPYESHNAYGWAGGSYRFDSWDQSIEVVSKTLREKYYDKGATSINQISRIYAPPSSTWAGNVKFFMRRIDPLPLSFTLGS